MKDNQNMDSNFIELTNGIVLPRTEVKIIKNFIKEFDIKAVEDWEDFQKLDSFNYFFDKHKILGFVGNNCPNKTIHFIHFFQDIFNNKYSIRMNICESLSSRGKFEINFEYNSEIILNNCTKSICEKTKIDFDFFNEIAKEID